MAEKIRDYTRLAGEIIERVGGVENINGASRCATRLRLVLTTPPADAKEKISSLPGVISVVERAGQFQVVIGTHVGEVFSAVAAQLPEGGKMAAEHKESALNRVIGTMAAVMTPFIYMLAAAGMLQGVLILMRMAWPEFAATGTHAIFNYISWTPFAFLPILVGITASRYFGCNIFIAVICCAALISPDWNAIAARIAGGEEIDFLGLALSSTTYGSSVLPPIFMVWLLSYVERFFDRVLPGLIKPFFTPGLCMAIMVPLTILVIGPLTTTGADLVAGGYNWLVDSVPVLAGALVGGLWQVPVIFGIHHSITPVIVSNFQNFGYDTFQTFQTIAVIGQMGAALGVALVSRNRDLRRVGLSAGVTGIFGITEPAIYGVTLRLKRPFVCGCLAGAAGAIVASFFHVKYFAYASLPGPLTVVNAISPEQRSSFIGVVIGCVIALVGSIILVRIIGFKDIPEEVSE
ncbi:MAG: PTS transporter subunit EIIC [Planctomycetes bacterium]|nr:PTS transporter subunit EIIC [Planctomycetota bacterium]